MRIIDLSLTVDSQMPGVNISVAKKLEVDGWNASTLEMYSHSGTHMDAPKHFLPDGAPLDQQDLEVMIGPAVVVDVSPAAPKQLIEITDFDTVEHLMKPGVRLLLRTDWHKRYGTPEYRNELPRLSVELARWLVEQQVALVGVEPPSVADVNNIAEVTEVHQILFEGNVVIVEALAHLDQLESQIVDFIALPLKIAGGDGCPVRAVAIVKESNAAE